jgi:thiol-disulfide isomerase/thioredoxin
MGGEAIMNRVWFSTLALVGLALFLAVVFQSPREVEFSPGDLPRLEKRQGAAPEFSLEKIAGGRLSLAELRGRPVLLNFWATWCEPCLQELPELVTFLQSPAGRKVALVLAAADEDPQAVGELAGRLQRLLAEGKISPQMAPLARAAAALVRGEVAGAFSVSDPGGQVARRYGTEKYPETYLIDGQGRLQLVFIGPQAWSGEDIPPLLEPFFHGGEQ